MARGAPRLAALRGLVLVAMLLPLENALQLERLDGRLGAVAEARRRRRTPRARRRLGAQLFRHAQQLMAQGRYQEAIRSFNRSFGLLPTPQTLLGLAQCYELSGQLERARRLYERIIKKPGGLSKTMLQKRLDALRQRLEAKPGAPEAIAPASQPASQPTEPPGPDDGDVTEEIGDGDVAVNVMGDGEGDITADIGPGLEEDQVASTSPLEVSGLLSGWIRAALDVDMAHDRSDGPTDILEDSLELRHRMLLRMNVRYGARYQGFVSTVLDHVIREQPPDGGDTFALFNGRGVSSELDASIVEAYLAISFWRLDIRGGLLRVPWGKSDYASPNDIINPRDVRNPLREELEILRLPVLALETEVNLAPFTVELIWQPVFRPDKLSLYGTDYGLATPHAPQPVRGLVHFIEGMFDDSLTPMVEQLMMQTELPSADGRASSGGIRIGLQLRGVDFSLIYHYGWDSSPHLQMDPAILMELAKIDWGTASLQTMGPLIQLVDAGTPLYRATFIRRHHTGADVVATLGSFTLRAEVGVDDRRLFYDPMLSAHIEPAVAVSCGADWNKSMYQLLTVEASYLHVGGGPEELLFYNQDYASIAMMARWGVLRGDLVGEVRAMIGITPWTYVVRPQVTYKITPRWWVTAGVVVLGGNERSVGGLFDRNDLVFFEGTFNL
jgi:hypothetical protein